MHTHARHTEGQTSVPDTSLPEAVSHTLTAPVAEPAMTYLPPPEKQALFQSQLFLYFSDLRAQRQRSIALQNEPSIIPPASELCRCLFAGPRTCRTGAV